MALVGTWMAGAVSSDILKAILGVGLFAVAASFLRSPGTEDVKSLNQTIQQKYGDEQAATCLTTAGGEQI